MLLSSFPLSHPLSSLSTHLLPALSFPVQFCGGFYNSQFNSYFTSVYATDHSTRWATIYFSQHARSFMSVLSFVSLENPGTVLRDAFDAITVPRNAPVLNNINITNSAGSGIAFLGRGNPEWPVVVRNIRIDRCAGHGLYTQSRACYMGCTFDNVVSTNNQYRGFSIEGDDSTLLQPITLSHVVSHNNGLINILDRGRTSAAALWIRGVYRSLLLNATIINSTFSSHPHSEEAVRTEYMAVQFIGCKFTDNTVALRIGALFASFVVVDNCLFSRNRAGLDVAHGEWQIPVAITNNVFTNNTGSFTAYIGGLTSEIRLGISSNATRGHMIANNTFTFNTASSGVLIVTPLWTCCQSPVMQHEIWDNVFASNSARYILSFFLQLDFQNATFFRNIFRNNFNCLSSLNLQDNNYGALRPLVRHNFFEDTACQFALYSWVFDRSSPIDARFNYWGTTDEFQILQNRIYDQLDDTTRERIDAFPFLLSSNLSDVVDINAPRRTFSMDGGIQGLVLGNAVLPTGTYSTIGDFVVDEGATLTIEPGTTIRFGPNRGFSIKGTLIAAGNLTHPITFTCTPLTNQTHVYMGCYHVPRQTNPNIRAMFGTVWKNTVDMTVDRCLAYCASQGFSYAGLNSFEDPTWVTYCMCGTSNPGFYRRAESDCNRLCDGNRSQICGGTQDSMSVYQTSACVRWGTLSFGPRSNGSIVTNTRILHAGSTSAAAVHMDTSRITFRDNEIGFSSGNCLQLADSSPDAPLSLTNLSIHDCNQDGVFIYNTACSRVGTGCSLSQLSVTRCGRAGLYIDVNLPAVDLFINNTAISDNGVRIFPWTSALDEYSGVYIAHWPNSRTVFFTNVSFSRNVNGHALVIGRNASALVQRCAFIDNGRMPDDCAVKMGQVGSYLLGQVGNYLSKAILNSTFVRNRQAINIMATTYARAQIIGCRFQGHSGGRRLIAILGNQYGWQWDNVDVRGNVFLNNSVIAGSQLVYFDLARYPQDSDSRGFSVRVESNVFRNNSAPGGSLIYLLTSTHPLMNGSFLNNVMIGNVASQTLNLLDDDGSGNNRWLFHFNVFDNRNTTYEFFTTLPDKNAKVDARFCYWGYTFDNEISARIFDSLINAQYERVEYFPYLQSYDIRDVIHSNATRQTFRHSDGSLGGLVLGDAVLTLAFPGPVYNVTSELIIDETASLTVEPGVTLQLAPGVSIDVKGRLFSRGTVQSPITVQAMPSASTTGRYIGCYYENGLWT
jgi:hypothetical protein